MIALVRSTYNHNDVWSSWSLTSDQSLIDRNDKILMVSPEALDYKRLIRNEQVHYLEKAATILAATSISPSKEYAVRLSDNYAFELRVVQTLMQKDADDPAMYSPRYISGIEPKDPDLLRHLKIRGRVCICYDFGEVRHPYLGYEDQPANFGIARRAKVITVFDGVKFKKVWMVTYETKYSMKDVDRYANSTLVPGKKPKGDGWINKLVTMKEYDEDTYIPRSVITNLMFQMDHIYREEHLAKHPVQFTWPALKVNPYMHVPSKDKDHRLQFYAMFKKLKTLTLLTKLRCYPHYTMVISRWSDEITKLSKKNLRKGSQNSLICAWWLNEIKQKKMLQKKVLHKIEAVEASEVKVVAI